MSYSILGKSWEFTNSLIIKIEKQTLVQGTIMEKLTQLHQIPKIPNLNF
jgi:hypothetical protein